MPTAYAGRYTLTSENPRINSPKPFTLCKDFEINLNRFSSKSPMVCEKNIHPDMKMLSKPDWKPLDPKKHIKLLQQIARERHSNLSKSKQDYYCELAKEHALNGRTKLWQAKFDISNTGRVVTVIRHDMWGCDDTDETFVQGVGLPGLAVLDETGKKLDPVYKALNKQYETSDVILHNNRVYFARWRGSTYESHRKLNLYDVFWTLDEFGVYTHKALCTYRFEN